MVSLGMKVLEKRVSPINGRITVARSLGLGTYIQVEGLTQSGGIVESIWRSTLRKVSKEGKVPKVSKVLILGLGGGSAVKVVRKLWPEAKITGVEIDPIMVELGRKYLGLTLDDIYIGDAERSIRRTKVRYDLILVDIYLGDKFPERFERPALLRLILKLLRPEGTVVFNRLYYGEKRPEAVKFGEKLKKIFPNVEYFYPEANLMFLCSL